MSTVFGPRRKARPARLPERLVSLAKPGRHGDGTFVPAGPGFVAHPLQGGDHLAHKLAGLDQHLLHQWLVDLGKGRQMLQGLVRTQYTGEHEMHVVGRWMVEVHGVRAGGQARRGLARL